MGNLADQVTGTIRYPMAGLRYFHQNSFNLSQFEGMVKLLGLTGRGSQIVHPHHNHRRRFNISDQGVGIPADDLERIFDPFYRAPNVRSFPGYGIGLPLVKKIVKMHGGEMSVQSEAGQGSSFRIIFHR